MDNKKDELNKALGAFISRRKMIQMMGFGTAGAAFLPSLLKGVHAQSPKLTVSPLSNFTPGPPIWDYTLPNPLATLPPLPFATPVITKPVFYNGTIILCTRNDNGTGSIYSLDTQTREERWTQRLNFPSSVFTQPIIANDVIYVANVPGSAGQTVLYAIDADAGNILWQGNYNVNAAPTLANGRLIFSTSDGRIVALNAQNLNQILWVNHSLILQGVVSSIFIVGDVVLIRDNFSITAVNLQNGATIWKYTIPTQPFGLAFNVELSIGNGSVYCTSNNGFLYAVDIATGHQIWQRLLNAVRDNIPVLLSAPVFYNEKVYVGGDDGRLSVVQADTGNLIGQPVTIPNSSLARNPILIEDGIAYLTAENTNSEDNIFYAVDLTSQGPDIVSYDPSGIGDIIGLETGICYCLILPDADDKEHIIAIDLANLVH